MSYIRNILLSVKIENWSTGNCDSNPFLAPEITGIHLRGQVYGHPGKTDGAWVKTSRIQSINGKMIETLNTIYELGEPNPDFLKWMKMEGIEFDPDNPIKTIKHGRQ
jgi:hypothetical protein